MGMGYRYWKKDEWAASESEPQMCCGTIAARWRMEEEVGTKKEVMRLDLRATSNCVRPKKRQDGRDSLAH